MRTEEEQVQALKQWWNENGKSLLLGVGLAVAVVVGWNGWQERQAVEAENASVLYQNMLDAVIAGSGPSKDQDQLATANHLAGQLKTEFENSMYARYAALIQARVAVDAKEFDKALTEIDWVLSHEPSPEMKVVATMRKARLQAAKGDLDTALSLLTGIGGDRFQVSIDELKGDLYLMKGDADAARAAYQSAKKAAEQGSARPLLSMKLDDLSIGEQ
ncbi:MAG: YfgM family protein [Pontibacterium sp.]